MRILFFFLLFVTSTALQAVQNNEAVGIILAVKNSVSITNKDGEKRNAHLKDLVYLGDRIDTKKRSYVQVAFQDGSVVKLSSNSDFTINDYNFDERKGEGKSVLRFNNATAGFLAGKISKIAPQNYKIETATATIGIRGSAGSFITSDGSQGAEAGLEIQVQEGHILTVTPVLENGNLDMRRTVVMSDPSQQTNVSQKRGIAVVAKQESFEQVLDSSSEGAEALEENPFDGSRRKDSPQKVKENESQEEESQRPRKPQPFSEEDNDEEARLPLAEGKEERPPLSAPLTTREAPPLANEIASVQENVSGTLESNLQITRDEETLDFIERETEADYQGALLGTAASTFLSELAHSSFSDGALYVKSVDSNTSFRLPLSSIGLSPSGSRYLGFSTLNLDATDDSKRLDDALAVDNLGEFILSTQKTATLTQLTFQGKKASNLPLSGYSLFESSSQDDPMEKTISGALYRINNIQDDDKFYHGALVSFDAGAVFGKIDDAEDDELEFLYAGLIDAQGRISNIRVMHSLSTDISERFDSNLTTLESSGLFGSKTQGLGIAVENADESDALIAAAFLETDTEGLLSTTSTDSGTYTGILRSPFFVVSSRNSVSPPYLQHEEGFVNANTPTVFGDTFSLTVDFDTQRLGGSLDFDPLSINPSLDATTLTLGSSRDSRDGFAMDRQFFYASIVDDNVDNSYLLALDLPMIWGSRPADVMWGSAQALYDDNGISILYPGQHTFWKAYNTNKSLSATSGIFKGGLMGTVAVGNDEEHLFSFTKGHTSLRVTNYVHMVHHLGYEYVIESSDGKQSGGQILPYIENFNNRFFAVSTIPFMDNDGSLIGSIIYQGGSLTGNIEYGGQFINGNNFSLSLMAEETSVSTITAVGVGRRVGDFNASENSAAYIGSFAALQRHKDGTILEYNPTDFLLDVAAGVISHGSDRVFVDREGWVLPQSHALSLIPNGILDGNEDFSYAASMPGTAENYTTLTWGVWGTRDYDDASLDTDIDGSFGIFALGLSSMKSTLADLTSIQGANSIFNYNGNALAVAFDAGVYQGYLEGNISFSLNVDSEAVMGSILFAEDTIDFSGSIDDTVSDILTFRASTRLNGGSVSNDTKMTGTFYNVNSTLLKESAGSYHASDATRSILGVYGAKRD